MSLGSASLITSTVVISTVLVLRQVPSETWATTATASLAAGTAALALMAMSAMLGSRWKVFDRLFGGLDRMYVAHKWLAIWALGLASFHFIFKAGLEQWDVAPILELSRPTARLIRQLSLLALGFIVILALNRAIPYRVWRWWHKLSGPLFLIVVLHWLSFPSPLGLATPAGIWLGTLAAAGIVGAAYKLLLYPFFSRHADYQVTSVERGKRAVKVAMKPVGRGVCFRAGQFGFLRFKEPGLREPHPFTVANVATQGGDVVFTIRALGDYTQRLVEQVSPAMWAEVYGPYGQFRRPTNASSEIWIAGGVGISPFLAWLQDDTVLERPVTLFYFFNPAREFPAAGDIAELATKSGVRLEAMPSGQAQSTFSERFAEAVGRGGGGNPIISFCGPASLKRTVAAEMKAHRIPAANLRFEHFEFR